MRLVDADKIEPHEQLESLGNGQYEYVRVAYMDDIDALLTVDAIQVVRCKDCKFFYQMTAETGICELGCPHLGNDGFCSEGERKDGGDG